MGLQQYLCKINSPSGGYPMQKLNKLRYSDEDYKKNIGPGRKLPSKGTSINSENGAVEELPTFAHSNMNLTCMKLLLPKKKLSSSL